MLNNLEVLGMGFHVRPIEVLSEASTYRVVQSSAAYWEVMKQLDELKASGEVTLARRGEPLWDDSIVMAFKNNFDNVFAVPNMPPPAPRLQQHPEVSHQGPSRQGRRAGCH